MKPEHNVTEELLHLYELALSIGKQLDPRETCLNFVEILVPRYGLIGASIWWQHNDSATPLAALPKMSAEVSTRALATRVSQLAAMTTPCILESGDDSHLALTAGFSGDDVTCGLYPFSGHGVLVMYSVQPGVITPRLLKSLRPILDALGTSIRGGMALEQLALSEMELKKQRGFLKTLINTIPDLVWLKDPDGVYLACNERFEQFFGVTEPHIIGKTDYDFVDAELADSFRMHDRRAMANNGPSVNEEWIPFASDSHRELLETTKTPMLDDDGALVGVLGIGHDITQSRESEEALRMAASVFTHANEGIIITDAEVAIIEVNQAFSRITGYSREEVLGKKPGLLKSDQNGDYVHAEMWQSLQQQGQWSGELWNRRKNGEIYAELLTISALYDEQGNVSRYLGLFSDITAQKQHQKQLEYLAHYDALTSLPNRILLSERLHQAMKQAQRRDSLLAVAYLDLDGFKRINDSFGHDTGDQLLVDLSSRFVHTLREGDTIARIGGDEFAIAMMDLADRASCSGVLDRLLEVAAEPMVVNGHRLRVSASVGVTFFPQRDEVDADQLLRQADQAMYQAKQSGKNRYHVFDVEKDRSLRDQVDSLSRIRAALQNNEFTLYYQPKVNMRTGEVIGVEALIRWCHPERGLLAPFHFLPMIENQHLTIDVGDWVIEAALKQLEYWQAQGIDLAVSINVNGYHLQQPDFFEKLRDRLIAHPAVNPANLELEILETSALEDIAHVSKVIRACQDLGIGFALDDFGTGYSSLTYLKRLQTRLLKIDQSFVRDMLDDPDDLSILDGVLGLAKSFKKDVIAEGVETLEHGEMLLLMGCELGQGYAIARPMPADSVPEWLAGWQPDEKWQQCKPVHADDRLIVHAIVEHRAWVTHLAQYVRGDHPIPPVLDVKSCRFGCWLTEFGDQCPSRQSEVEEITRLHNAIHQQGEQLIQCYLDGFDKSMDALLASIRTLQEELIQCLKQLVR